MNPAEE